MFKIEMNEITFEGNLVIIALEVSYQNQEYDAYLRCDKELNYVELFSKQNGSFDIHDISKVDPVEEFGSNSSTFYNEVYKIPSMVKHTILACC